MLAFFFLHTTLAVAAETPARPPAELGAYRQLVAALAAPEMEGRGAGTAGIDKARDLLVARLRDIGLRPAFHIDGRDTFTQPFEIRLGVTVNKQSLALLDPLAPGNADAPPIEDFEADEQFSVLGFSGQGAFAGPAVFVGYGIVNPRQQYDSYQAPGSAPAPGIAIKGKVVIAFRYEPMDERGRSLWSKSEPATLGAWTESASLLDKARWAAERGAVAMLVVDPPAQDMSGTLKSARRSEADTSATIPVMHIRSNVLRRLLRRAGMGETAIPELQRRANAGKDHPLPLPGVVLRGEARLDHPRAAVHNIAAVLPGAGDLRDEYLVVGAHYDHLGYGDIGSFVRGHVLHPGADDNASGAAAIVTLARRMKSLAEASAPGTPGNPATPAARRSILFTLFSGEERGLLGSSHMLKHPDDLGIRHDQLRTMINFDMIGRLRGGRLFVFGTGSGDGLPQLIRAANESLGLGDEKKLTLRTDASAIGASDHTSFYFAKVPALHLFTGAHEDYHRPSDTAEKINAPGALRVVDFTQALLLALWDAPETPRFHAQPEGAHAAGVAGPIGGATLGIMPDYLTLEGADGAGVDQVMPNSPAQKAGLKPGDVILRWNHQPLPNVRALTSVLRESKPGEKVTLTVQRNGSTVDMDVTLGQR